MKETQILKAVEQLISLTSTKDVIKEPKYIRTQENGTQISDRNMKVSDITLRILDLIKEIEQDEEVSYGDNEYQIRIINWRDSNIYIEQCDINSDFPVATLTSIGFVIQEDDKKIVLAGDIIDGQVRRVISIPKENIID